MDETTAPVLDPGKGKTKTGYLWALARDDRRWGGSDPPGVVYFYAPGRGGGHAETFLDGFDGILQIDGYAGYNRLTKPSRKGGDPLCVAYCWAHARRKLREVFERDGSEIAREGLERIAKLYEIEAEIRGLGPRPTSCCPHGTNGAPGRELWHMADRAALPRLCQIPPWREAHLYRQPLGAVCRLSYPTAASRWTPTPSRTSSARLLSIARMHCSPATMKAVEAWGRIASLIETAKINGIEPFAYLKATLEAIAGGHPNDRLDELLPQG